MASTRDGLIGKVEEQFDIILDCLNEFAVAVAKDQKAVFSERQNVFHDIPAPRRGGKYIIGPRGTKAIYAAVDHLLEIEPDLKGRIGKGKIGDVIKSFYSKIILRRTKLSDFLAAKQIIDCCIRYIRSHKLETTTYVLPVIFIEDSDGEPFNVGPVRFVPTKRFLTEIESHLARHEEDALRRNIEGERKVILGERPRIFPGKENDWPLLDIKKHSTFFTNEFREYIGRYKWVAIVRIENFEPKSGLERANLCVEAALNAIRLIIGASHSDEFRVGGKFRIETDPMRLRIEDDGKIEIGWTRRSEGSHVRFKELKEHMEYYGGVLATAGSLIGVFAKAGTVPVLYQKIFDAWAWYGEAVSEPHAHAKLLRYVTAMERLVVTSDAGRRRQVIDRGGLLCAYGEFHRLRHFESKITKCYNARSQLVHGGVSQFDESVISASHVASEVTQKMMLAGLFWYLFLVHEDREMKPDLLDRYYQRFLHYYADWDGVE